MMQLRYSPTSPYVRKVSVMAIETGLSGQIDRVLTNPWDPQTDLGGTNPLGKVPALITPDGVEIFDSRVICEHLDAMYDGEPFFPREPKTRSIALRLQALADGILDAAILRLIEERRRPGEYCWPVWCDRQATTMNRSLDWLEERRSLLDSRLTIGSIAVGCMLGYLDFRYADEDWREGRDGLASWYSAFAQRPSMRDTVPVE